MESSASDRNFPNPCRSRNRLHGNSSMQLLLDTHALLWWLSGDAALSAVARTAIADEANGIFISAASACEMATKHRIGKWPGIAAVIADLDRVIADQGFVG